MLDRSVALRFKNHRRAASGEDSLISGGSFHSERGQREGSRSVFSRFCRVYECVELVGIASNARAGA
jgi:hypothetical protein